MFRDLIVVLWETGCRPQEARSIEAAFIDHQNRRLIFPLDLSKGEEHERVVYLTPKAYEILLRCTVEYPTGPLLRNSKGRPWDRNSMRCRFRRLNKKLKIPGLCAYAFRHTWITNALINGVDAITVAVVAGHSDVAMAAKSYQHLAGNVEFLQQQVLKAVTQRGTGGDHNHANSPCACRRGGPAVEGSDDEGILRKDTLRS